MENAEKKLFAVLDEKVSYPARFEKKDQEETKHGETTTRESKLNRTANAYHTRNTSKSKMQS